MDRPNLPIDFTQTIEIFAKVENRNGPVSEAEKPTTDASKGDHIVVHRALLEASSKFFQNSLGDAGWKEGSEKRIDLIVSQDVLSAFGNWLYNRAPDQDAPWQFWIDLYIFSCEYLITELAGDIICGMLSKLQKDSWTPSLEQIDDIYDRTAEDFPLRTLAVHCFGTNTQDDKTTILRAANEAFVRDYAISAFSSSVNLLEDITERYGHPRQKSFPRCRIDLAGFVKFRIKNTDEVGIIHSNIIDSSLGSEGRLYSANHPAFHSYAIVDATFKTFAYWLYFGNILRFSRDGRQISQNFPHLLRCYEMSFTQTECEVEAAKERENGSLDKRYSNALRSKTSFYKLGLVNAFQTYWERRQRAPSVEELDRIYLITSTGDPLRRLSVDVCISIGKSRIEDIMLEGFQSELIARLVGKLDELCVYVDKERSMRENIRKVKGYSDGNFASSAERLDFYQRVQELMKFEPPPAKKLIDYEALLNT